MNIGTNPIIGPRKVSTAKFTRNRGSNAEMDKSIDQAAAMIVERAVRGLNEAIMYCTERAQHYAPVREVFKKNGGARPTEFRRGGSAGQGASAGVRTRKPMYIRTQSAMDAYLGSRPHSRRIVGPKMSDGGDRIILRGHANSFEPLLDTGLYQHSGDFRRVERGTSKKTGRPMFRLAEVSSMTMSPTGVSSSIRMLDPERDEMSGGMHAREFLSSRGRYELHKRPGLVPLQGPTPSGRPISKPTAIHRDAFGVERVGGTLRDSIKPILAVGTKTTSNIWGYVMTDVDYAKYQEFGTRHNRANPFLRPALYDSRSYLGNAVRRSLKGGNRYATSTSGSLKNRQGGGAGLMGGSSGSVAGSAGASVMGGGMLKL